MQLRPAVLGVDGCRTGWVGIVADGDGFLRAGHDRSFASLLNWADGHHRITAVGVDIPIGLPDARTPVREADLLARKFLGPRWQTIFLTPIREALEHSDYATANSLSRDLAGVGISRQAYALREKILQVDAWVRSGQASPRVIEVHPECSFATMAAAPLSCAKRTWAGQAERRRLLSAVGYLPVDDLGAAGRAAADDVLDAAAAAWTAWRHTTGVAVSLPDPPQLLHGSITAAIWR